MYAYIFVLVIIARVEISVCAGISDYLLYLSSVRQVHMRAIEVLGRAQSGPREQHRYSRDGRAWHVAQPSRDAGCDAQRGHSPHRHYASGYHPPEKQLQDGPPREVFQTTRKYIITSSGHAQITVPELASSPLLS